MEKLSNLEGWFTYNGKHMPVEFAEICKLDEFQTLIENRKAKPYRYFEKIKNYLKYDFKGDLPKDPAGVARKLGYTPYKSDIFYMTEKGYKNVYPKEYDDFFKNKPLKEQKKIFYACDFGGRNIYQYMQDVFSGNIIEDMVAYYTKGILSPNDKASGRGEGDISTNCDFIFRSPERPGYSYVEVPVELKTKWEWELKDNEIVQVRGSVKTIVNTGGMILVIYVKLNKAVLIDLIGKHYEITPGKMGDKDCDDIHISKDDIVDFKFWDKEDVKKMMHMIYDQYKLRETK